MAYLNQEGAPRQRGMKKRKGKYRDGVFHMSAEENTLWQMPKFYPASRCGAHKSEKDYDRKRDRQRLRKEIDDEQE